VEGSAQKDIACGVFEGQKIHGFLRTSLVDALSATADPSALRLAPLSGLRHSRVRDDNRQASD
jgi:hypothetical protein